MGTQIEIAVERGDILEFEADVIALKYAQEFYGADLAFATRLSKYQKQSCSITLRTSENFVSLKRNRNSEHNIRLL